MILAGQAVSELSISELSPSIMPADPEAITLSAERVLNASTDLDRVRLTDWTQTRAGITDFEREF